MNKVNETYNQKNQRWKPRKERKEPIEKKTPVEKTDIGLV